MKELRMDEIDKNFKVETELDLPDVKFYDPRLEPFTIYGVWYESGQYRRMPDKIAESVNPSIHILSKECAGGRVKFRTNSSYIAIHTECKRHIMPHFALTGSSGFDVYTGLNEKYRGTIIPPWNCNEFSGYEGKVVFGDKKMREVTLNLPLYSPVFELYIGLEEGAKIEKTAGYKYEKPVLYYGSSITQGGCASRAGMSYEGIISRALKTNYINLGFSGNALAEDIMADYIAGLDMSIFVYDYDHNAPNPEHLEKTHERMFKRIREAHPDLPVIMLSRPKYYINDVEKKRLAIVKKTYENAVANGDKNVYFIPGPSLMKYAKDNGTVDGCHPTDFGFASMARVLTPLIKKILEANK